MYSLILVDVFHLSASALESELSSIKLADSAYPLPASSSAVRMNSRLSIESIMISTDLWVKLSKSFRLTRNERGEIAETTFASSDQLRTAAS